MHAVQQLHAAHGQARAQVQGQGGIGHGVSRPRPA
jgi:hypothetical protein